MLPLGIAKYNGRTYGMRKDKVTEDAHGLKLGKLHLRDLRLERTPRGWMFSDRNCTDMEVSRRSQPHGSAGIDSPHLIYETTIYDVEKADSWAQVPKSNLEQTTMEPWLGRPPVDLDSRTCILIGLFTLEMQVFCSAAVRAQMAITKWQTVTPGGNWKISNLRRLTQWNILEEENLGSARLHCHLPGHIPTRCSAIAPVVREQPKRMYHPQDPTLPGGAEAPRTSAYGDFGAVDKRDRVARHKEFASRSLPRGVLGDVTEVLNPRQATRWSKLGNRVRREHRRARKELHRKASTVLSDAPMYHRPPISTWRKYRNSCIIVRTHQIELASVAYFYLWKHARRGTVIPDAGVVFGTEDQFGGSMLGREEPRGLSTHTRDGVASLYFRTPRVQSRMEVADGVWKPSWCRAFAFPTWSSRGCTCDIIIAPSTSPKGKHVPSANHSGGSELQKLSQSYHDSKARIYTRVNFAIGDQTATTKGDGLLCGGAKNKPSRINYDGKYDDVRRRQHMSGGCARGFGTRSEDEVTLTPNANGRWGRGCPETSTTPTTETAETDGGKSAEGGTITRLVPASNVYPLFYKSDKGTRLSVLGRTSKRPRPIDGTRTSKKNILTSKNFTPRLEDLLEGGDTPEIKTGSPRGEAYRPTRGNVGIGMKGHRTVAQSSVLMPSNVHKLSVRN
ncbi:hypothetical protein BV22DRAFT_1046782 [Leucogyrophana mollusca]|uniref:Uncharacterized protein n=1 Tax=Leucogyrophana mollusca TaxID=85980 RepID=A0ACB8BLL4_9AGAM|nr:hypothetical protein BV22DRAFT_1046782 [Leucogyrophana mollusca]